MLRSNLVTLCFALLLGVDLSATHMSGGEIYADCLGNDQYEISLIIYRDCAGVNLNPDFDVIFSSPCDTFTVQVNTPAGVEISQLCDIELPNSTCSGGLLPGIEQYTYTTTATLPPCSDWTIGWFLTNRNGAIVNLTNPNQQQLYIETTLDNVTAPCNDSPTFDNPASSYVCLNYPINYSMSASDPEGDSLVYRLISARGEFMADLQYTAPHTPLEPIPGISIDPNTGLLSFTMTQAGNWVVVVEVDEYDSAGNLIGTIMRDMQFVAYPCSNIPPDASSGSISNPNGNATILGPNSIQMCESGSTCFDLVITDDNAGDTLVPITNIADALPGATFSFSGSNPITCTICWTGSDGLAGFYPFTITVDDGACPIPAAQSYAYTIEVIDGVFLDLQATDASCTGQTDGSVQSNVLDGLPPYQYLWSTGATTPNITGGSGTYSLVVTDANGCVSTGDSAIITAPTPPVANGGGTFTHCDPWNPVPLNGNSTNAASSNWSGGSGIISGSGATATYTSTASDLSNGAVTLQYTAVSGNSCPNDTDNVVINLSAGFSNSLITITEPACAGAASGSASYSPDIASYSYQWNTTPVQTTATASGLSAGTYELIVTDALGCDTTLQVIVQEPASLSTGSVQVTAPSCSNIDDGNVTVNVTGGSAPYSYLWNTGDTLASISVDTGSYSVTVTDANGCVAMSNTATVTAPDPPTADAGSDLIHCLSDSSVNLNGFVTNASGVNWTGGTGSFSGSGATVDYTPGPSDILNGGVDVGMVALGVGGCPNDTDVVHVSIGNSFLGAVISVNPPCFGTSSGEAIYQPAHPWLSYAWNTTPPQYTPVASGLGAGTYSISVSDSLGCDTVLSTTIGQPPMLVLDSISVTSPTCFGDSSGIITAFVSGGTPAYSYNWSNSAQVGQTVSNVQAGWHSVTVVDASGCNASDSVQVQQPMPIDLQVSVPDTVCVNAPVLLTGAASGGTGNLTIGWSGIGTGDSISYSFPANQLVSVSVTDAVGCSGPVIDQPVYVLDFNDHLFTTTDDTIVCPGTPAQFGAILGNYPGTVNMNWPTMGLNGLGPFSFYPDSTMTIPVIAVDGCGVVRTDSVRVEVDNVPLVSLPDTIAIGCEDLTVQFQSPVGGIYGHQWSLGDGNISNASSPIHIYNAGTYPVSLTITTPIGCSSSTDGDGLVIVHATPNAAFTPTNWNTNVNVSTVPFFNGSNGDGLTNMWTFGDGNSSSDQDPIHTYATDGVFPVTLTVTDTNGCSDAVTHFVTLTPSHDVTIPNAFTPSGGSSNTYDPNDLSNDVFYPIADDVVEMKMQIYNRWGELIFQSTELNKGWNGYYKGQMSQQDNYVYIIWLRFKDNVVVERSGDITLLR